MYINIYIFYEKRKDAKSMDDFFFSELLNILTYNNLTALAGARTPQSILHLKYRTPPTAPSFSP